MLDDLTDQKDIPFGMNQARREVELFEIIYEKGSISVSDLAHHYEKYVGEIQTMLEDLQEYGLVKVFNRRKHEPLGDEAVGMPYKSVTLTDRGKHFGDLIRTLNDNIDALIFVRNRKDHCVVDGEIAKALGFEDDKDIIKDFEDNGIVGFWDGVYWISNIGDRLADILDYRRH